MIDQAISKIATAESDRREAESLVENNQLDFEKQFTENEMALEEANKKVCYYRFNLLLYVSKIFLSLNWNFFILLAYGFFLADQL